MARNQIKKNGCRRVCRRGSLHYLILMSAAASADASSEASAAWKNIKAKKIDFYHSIRHVNVYGTYIRVGFILLTPPPKKGAF